MMATFNNSAAYSILSTQKGTYYVQGGHYFSPTTFVDLGTTAPTDYQSLSSERSDQVSITGGALDGVTVGANSTIQASVSGSVTNATITGSTITGGTIDGAPIGQSTPAAGAFTSLNATSAGILGPLSAEGINSTANGQVASITNTGTAMSSTFAAVTYFDAARTANNKTADFLWTGGTFSARFKNDAGSSTATWLSAAGGQAAGVSSVAITTANTSLTAGNNTITSNSGSGSWVHTGAFSASGAVNASGGLTVKEGANAKQGVATLVAGTVTVSNTSITATSRIQLTVQSLGTVTAPKAIAVTARVAGTSFTITSADNTDTSVVAYEIFEVGS
jgi:hypothetical protein